MVMQVIAAMSEFELDLLRERSSSRSGLSKMNIGSATTSASCS
jgi:hypothetical protein